MKHISTIAHFTCIGNIYDFHVNILIELGGVLRFSFKASRDHFEKLPLSATRFDVIMSPLGIVLFDRLAASENPMQEAIRECVEDYVRAVNVDAM